MSDTASKHAGASVGTSEPRSRNSRPLDELAREYLESAGFKILLHQNNYIVADKLVFGQDRDTWVIWTIPSDRNLASYEPTLRGAIAEVRPNYPDAKLYLVSRSRSGLTREFQQGLSDQKIRWLVPIQFFDAAFRVEEAPKAASAIADIRSLDVLEKRVPQPYSVDRPAAGEGTSAPDLFQKLISDVARTDGPRVNVVVGRAGIGKSFMFRALFARLYENFRDAKNRLAKAARPIPLMPEYLKGTFALRTELLVENFLRTDVASPVPRETFEWLLVNGFTTWLLDGLDELYAGDPQFFDYVSDLITRSNSSASITIWCRDSLMTTSDAFAEFAELCAGSDMLHIYKLDEWGPPSKRFFAWVNLENRQVPAGEQDTERVAGFLKAIDRTTPLRALSGLPFYCSLLLQEYQEGQLAEFTDDATLLDYVVDRMVKREIEKELLDLRLLVKDGLSEWLEDLAMSYVEGRYADIDREEAREYGSLVIEDGVAEKTQQHLLLTLLQFPLFKAGAETGRIAFTHDLIAEALAARAYVRRLRKYALDVGQRMNRLDLEDPNLLRFIARRFGNGEEAAVIDALRGPVPEGRAFSVLLSLLMIARPERDLLKRARIELEARELAGVRFKQRDLSGMSLRHSDLSGALFADCDLREARFEAAVLSRTRFDGENQLHDARLVQARLHSVFVGRRFIEDPQQIRAWTEKATGHAVTTDEPCPTALQIQHLFGKFITPLGAPRRDDLKHDALCAGKRWPGAAPTEECVDTAVSDGYFTGPDFRHRYRRAEGDRYAEMVHLVRDGSVSDGLGRLIGSVCRRRGCTHQLQF